MPFAGSIAPSGQCASLRSFAILSGRRALITGASQGLGREIARAFLASAADVAICARSEADIWSAGTALAEEFPQRRIVALQCDISRTEQLDSFYMAAIEALGALDIVVNNAGIHGPIGRIDEIDWHVWKEAIATNLLGTAYSCRLAIRHFKSQRRDWRAKIVNLSGGGATAPQPGVSGYGASKAGLVRLTETLAKEVEADGIDINALAPGAHATRLTRELFEAGPGRVGHDHLARIGDLLEKGGASFKRAAACCVYLASAEGDGLTGRLISAVWDPWPFADEIKQEIARSDIYALRRVAPKERDKT